MKHKHAELIKAWADGAEIQYRHWGSDWKDSTSPTWDVHWEYRIKPEEKKPVVRWLWAKQYDGQWILCTVLLSEHEALEKFSGVFYKLEWSRTEFPK